MSWKIYKNKKGIRQSDLCLMPYILSNNQNKKNEKAN